MLDQEGNWVDKVNKNGNVIDTTMFPNNWNKERILEEIAFAFENKVADQLSSTHFKGVSTNNIEIEFVISNNEVKTVYPKLN